MADLNPSARGKSRATKLLIFDVLVDNQNGYLSPEEIARRAFGAGFMKQTKKTLIRQVKGNMGHVANHAAEHGMVVVSKKKPTAAGSKLSHRDVIGWKIAGVEDKAELIDDLQHKTERIEGYKDKYDGQLQLGLDRHILDKNDDVPKIK